LDRSTSAFEGQFLIKGIFLEHFVAQLGDWFTVTRFVVELNAIAVGVGGGGHVLHGWYPIIFYSYLFNINVGIYLALF
jgi:hypothetical protein